ncbi:MAG: DNA mismatch repair ATPase MutS, partial [Cyclobacteriaceae bacterium]
FITSPFSIFTSMRTRDNLSESTSSFYAELKRIRRLLVNLTETKKPMLYFLDEILKGTNSKDRFNGAKKLIERLIKEDAYGFISTHDLELAIEFEEIPEVKNFSFNSSLHEGKLLFDYKISNEVCRSTNASELMEIMGIIGPEPKS